MNDLNSYIWKEKKISKNRNEKQKEIKLVDMSEKELNKAYEHCKMMLYNNSNSNPGRMVVLDLISKQINDCGAELALRWFKSLRNEKDEVIYTNSSLLIELRNYIASINYDPKYVYKLQDFIQTPPDYKSVTLESVMKACLDSLGKFDQSHITYSFIYKLGIWFTSEELTELNNEAKGNSLKEKLYIIKNWLHLDDSVEINLNPSGLTLGQFTSMIHLKRNGKNKYSELTTDQLITLRNKVLYSLEEVVLYHIKMWKDLMSKIEEVANYKQFKLNK